MNRNALLEGQEVSAETGVAQLPGVITSLKNHLQEFYLILYRKKLTVILDKAKSPSD